MDDNAKAIIIAATITVGGTVLLGLFTILVPPFLESKRRIEELTISKTFDMFWKDVETIKDHHLAFNEYKNKSKNDVNQSTLTREEFTAWQFMLLLNSIRNAVRGKNKYDEELIALKEAQNARSKSMTMLYVISAILATIVLIFVYVIFINR